MALLTSDNALDAMEVDAAEIAARMAEAVLAEVAEHAAVRDRRFAEEPSWYDDVGHMPFLEDAARSDRERGALAARVAAV